MAIATSLTFIDSGVMLLDYRHAASLRYQSVIRQLIAFYLFIWSVLCLYLEASTVEFIMLKN